jgi:ribosomal-protein-alanine N-acetyltransferase
MDDASPVYENWASDDEVTRYLTWPAYTSPDITRAVF